LIKNVILIGNGSHAKKRIIPSLNKKKIKINKIFSSKDSLVKIFNSSTKIKNPFFYICTPPDTHFKIINFLLLKKQNVIVEKPAVLKLNQFKILKKTILLNKKNIFIENLMYQNSKIFLNFIKYFNKNQKKISKIDINFLIPNFFKIGFRSKSIENFIILYDIGIYPISLLNILKIKILEAKVLNKTIYQNKIKKLYLQLNSDKFKIKINIGNNRKYINNIILTHNNGSKVFFDKIFNGTKVNKEIIFENPKLQKTHLIKDHDCFDKLFSFDLRKLLHIKKQSLKLIEKNILLLNIIKSKIKSD
jgi:hypothetical protein